MRTPRTIILVLTFSAWSGIAWTQGLPNVQTIPTPSEPDAIALYPGVAPGSEHATQTEIWGTFGPSGRIVRNVTRPTLTAYRPPEGKATGVAMIVAPGGAFQMLSIDNEGHQVARWLAERGVTAFVLKYRVNPTSADPAAFLKELSQMIRSVTAPGAPKPSTPPEAFADAKAAIALVRGRAAEWGIDSTRVGFMGFSAGAMTTLSVGLAADAAARPNFIAPIYPPMGGQIVPPDAPPMFVAIAVDDQLFGGGQLALVQDWIAAKRPTELHMFERGGHGFGMRPQNTTSDHWIDELFWWLQARGYLKSQER